MVVRLLTAFSLLGASIALPTRRGSSLAQLSWNASSSEALPELHEEEVAARENTTLFGAKKVNLAGPDSSLLSLAEAEVNYELNLSSENGGNVHNKISLAIVSMLGLGLCGVDRCCMGQVFLGFMKGLSCGGLFIWFIVDYWVILINTLLWRTSLKTAAFSVTFGTGTTAPAFFLSFFLLVPTVAVFCSSPRRYAVNLLTFLRRRGLITVGPFSTEVNEVFSRLDKDDDGFIGKEDLSQGLRELGCKYSDEEMEKIMSKADKEGDGKLSIEALVADLPEAKCADISEAKRVK